MNCRNWLLLGGLLPFLQITPHADEGMWLLNNPPRRLLQEKYQFNLTDPWLDHVMKSCVRFNSGGSGSFVSDDGLVISNHHVGADALQKVSTREHDYLRQGFHARTTQEEIRCVDLELNVLQSIEDVTARVNASVPPELSGEQALLKRRQVIEQIQAESLKQTGLRSDVVTLYQGGAYHLYRFKRYTDIRIVFAPEQQIAFYGGDPDNFEFPRYDLDICIFRVYENGQPVKPAHFLRWSKSGAVENELTFVAGHPGRTERLLTTPELEYLRDVSSPYALGRLKRIETLLLSWSARNPENARRAKKDLFGAQNSRKALDGRHAGLVDPILMDRKLGKEQAFKGKLRGKPEFEAALTAFETIAKAQQQITPLMPRYPLLETGHAFAGDCFHFARVLLRSMEERTKPNGDRLEEFADSKKTSLELDLFSERPIFEDYEILRLTDSLTFAAEQLGYVDPTIQAILAGKSPRARATELVKNTSVRDSKFRRELYLGGPENLHKVKDPMVELARVVDAEARVLRKKFDALAETKKQAHAAISSARFALEGTDSYPDATFTLRLAFGPVAGYVDEGNPIPAFTTFAGLFERGKLMNYRTPFEIPQSWMKRKSRLNPATPFNFVSTADIIGGNSGSPVINRNGEFVGIIFDGNIQSLILDIEYNDEQARAVSVHSSAILEALTRVYDADEIARELVSGHRQ
jgi:hypothetical protein